MKIESYRLLLNSSNNKGDFYKFPVLITFNNDSKNFCTLYAFYWNLFVFLSIT